MKFNWIKFLDKYRIEYVEVGPNVKKGNVNIHCPFCGTSDQSHHMGLDPSTSFWGCWRSADHRGRNPVRLVKKLLNCSHSKADEIVGNSKDVGQTSDFTYLDPKYMFSEESLEESVGELFFPEEFKSIKSYGITKKFFDYLDSRNFRRKDVKTLISDYQLCCSLYGDYSNRVIFPVFKEGVLVTWTSRAISDSIVRYKALDNEKSILPPPYCLYNVDSVKQTGGYILFIVEGPIDCLKLDYYGKTMGCRAIGLFTKTLSDTQKYDLFDLVSKFSIVIFMLDKGETDGESMAAELGIVKSTPVLSMEPPFDVKDAGELLPSQVKKFCVELMATLENEDGTLNIKNTLCKFKY